jgi:hypothetical protein
MTGGLHARRYMITMMGFFAVYAGLIYTVASHLASICSELALRLTVSLTGRREVMLPRICPVWFHESVYPFGLDLFGMS